MASFPKSQRLIGFMLLTALGILVPISAASAHTELIRTSPAADSVVVATEDRISLTFSEPPLVDGAAIIVMTSNGDILDSPAPALSGASISIPWPADLTPGNVSIQWRATAQDGHVESGEFVFNFTAAAESGPVPAASGDALPVESAEPMMTALATPEAIATPLAVAEVPTEEDSNLIIGIALVSLFGLVAAGFFLRRSK